MSIQFGLKSGNAWNLKTDALVIGVLSNADEKKAGKLPKEFMAANAKLNGALQDAYQTNVFNAKPGQLFGIRTLGKLPAARVILAGLGVEKDLDSDVVRNAMGGASSVAREGGAKNLVFGFGTFENQFYLIASAKAAVEGITLAQYAFDTYKSNGNWKTAKTSKASLKKVLKSADLFVPHINDSLKQLVRNHRNMAVSQNWAREWANLPSNIATPTHMASLAKGLAKEYKLKFKVYGRTELQKMKMNAFLAVASGSIQEPKLVVLEYAGRPGGSKAARESKKHPIVLVGKGITFDTGGISIKPAPEMDKMKHDKCGAVAVLQAVALCAKLGLHSRVIAVTPFTENTPSGSAYKPGDIITAFNGKKIEVLNTDAEGRMVLSDALAFADKTFKPSAMVDVATLTGACVVALGDVYSGIFSPPTVGCLEVREDIQHAGRETGERSWPLPLTKEYEEKVKSDVADFKNLGEPGGAAGATAGAAFLKQFVSEDTPWVHIDIAGTAYTSKPKGAQPAGATGVGTRLLAQWIANRENGKTKD